MEGLVHIYTGDGKGKTTAAVGLGLRAWGRGKKVLMVQFLKGMESGELIAIDKLGEGFMVNRGKFMGKFTWDMSKKERKESEALQKRQLEYAWKQMKTDQWDMLILDEILAAIAARMVRQEDVLALIDDKPDRLELVLTGRNAPDQLVDAADYVSEIRERKHPFQRGIGARRGIED